jgi:uncharacterized protein
VTTRRVKLGIVADTHMPRHGRALPRALVEGFRDQDVELILHLGDITEPDVVGWFEQVAPFDAVAGNNDGPELVARFGRRKVLEVGGVRVGLIHGDGARGTTKGRASAAFDADPVDVVLYGHSHIPHLERRGDVWLLNPGSPSDKRRQPRYSWATLEVAGGEILPRLHFFDDRSP